MVILLPLLESDRLKNGSVITLIDTLITSKQLLLGCSVTAHRDARQFLEENQGVSKLGLPPRCLGSTKGSLRSYIHDATEQLDFEYVDNKRAVARSKKTPLNSQP
jgi:hypothetical protein